MIAAKARKTSRFKDIVIPPTILLIKLNPPKATALQAPGQIASPREEFQKSVGLLLARAGIFKLQFCTSFDQHTIYLSIYLSISPSRLAIKPRCPCYIKPLCGQEKDDTQHQDLSPPKKQETVFCKARSALRPTLHTMFHIVFFT